MGLKPPYQLCFVNSMRSWGGAEVWMLETALALREAGIAVEFVTNSDSQLRSRAQAEKLPVKAMPIRIDGAVWTIASLAMHFRKSSITAIVANTTKDVSVAAPAGFLARVPNIFATRESDFPLKSRIDHRWHFSYFCTGVLVNSKATQKTILESAPWLNPSRVHLLYKGIDVDRFTPGEAKTGRTVIGAVGQLIARKGVPEIMRAWSVIDSMNFESRPILRMAGEGVLKKDLEVWCASLEHPEDVELLGYTENIEAFYRGLNMLLIPSHSEGFGLAAAEAACCEVPVIAGDASSLPEIVIDGETGLLVKPGDSNDLLQAMLQLMNNPAKARSMGIAGRKLVLDRYPREKTLNRLLQLTGHPDYSIQ